VTDRDLRQLQRERVAQRWTPTVAELRGALRHGALKTPQLQLAAVLGIEAAAKALGEPVGSAFTGDKFGGFVATFCTHLGDQVLVRAGAACAERCVRTRPWTIDRPPPPNGGYHYWILTGAGSFQRVNERRQQLAALVGKLDAWLVSPTEENAIAAAQATYESSFGGDTCTRKPPVARISTWAWFTVTRLSFRCADMVRRELFDHLLGIEATRGARRRCPGPECRWPREPCPGEER